MDADGAQIILGSGAFGALCGVVSSWIKARFGKTTVAPQPLEVKGAARYVTCEQCDLRHREVDERLKAGTRAFEVVRSKIEKVEEKMDTNQHDVMGSIQKLNDRVAPIGEACAENGAAIRILLGENLKPRAKT